MTEENKTGSEEQHFQEIMKTWNIKLLGTREEVDAIFNISTLDREEPEIHVKRDSILIFDSPDFNHAYILDEVNKFLVGLQDFSVTEKLLMPAREIDQEQFDARKQDIYAKVTKEQSLVDLYYIENEELHMALFERFLANRNSPTLNPPALIMVSPKSNLILIDVESMFPIDAKKVLMAYLMLADSENVKKSMQQSINMDQTAGNE
jgi:hypothetical protein